MARSLLVTLTTLLIGTAPATASPAFPEILPLPDGFRPEGIAIGRGTTFYVGSIPTGAIWKGDIRTGAGSILVPAQSGRAAIGLEYDPLGRLWVAGGPTGKGFVYDASTGETLAVYQLTTGTAFINDVVLTKDGAWFTDSPNPVLHRVPLGPGGELPAHSEAVPVTGDYTHQPPPAFNLNGIHATPDGETLIVVQSGTGAVYTVDASSGEASRVDLGGETLTQGDGILLDGKTLYVVRNRQHRIAIVDLAADLSRGDIVGYITHPAFDVPTTIAEHGTSLYAVNARFGAPDPGGHYEAVRVPKA
jgi:sugar lactone lactonase YvrE